MYDDLPVRPMAMIAAPLGTPEANELRQFAPIYWIEPAMFRADQHQTAILSHPSEERKGKVRRFEKRWRRAVRHRQRTDHAAANSSSIVYNVACPFAGGAFTEPVSAETWMGRANAEVRAGSNRPLANAYVQATRRKGSAPILLRVCNTRFRSDDALSWDVAGSQTRKRSSQTG